MAVHPRRPLRSASSIPRTTCLRSVAHSAGIQDSFQRRQRRHGQQTRTHRVGRAESAGAVSPDRSVIERLCLRPLHSGYASFRRRSRLSDELAPLGLDQRLKPAKESIIRPKPDCEPTLALRSRKNDESTVNRRVPNLAKKLVNTKDRSRY